ncbi:MAG: transglutaminase domain-containing protein, partial [Candidatus Hydrogenedentes bacterium]|nr:transglutaminase domain-containing protein [Candidatus Hydrogenedentota bacterium]
GAAFGEYFLVMHAAALLTSNRDTAPPLSFLYGAAAVSFCGDFFQRGSQEVPFQVGVLVYVALNGLVLATSQPRTSGPAARRAPRRTVATAVLIAASVGGAWFGSYLLATYGNAIDQWLGAFANGMSPLQTQGFSREARLDSVNAIKSKNADKIALRVIAEDEPGYLRAIAYDHYAGSRWEATGAKMPVPRARQAPIAAAPDRSAFAVRPYAPETPLRELEVWPDASLGENVFAPAATALVAAEIDRLSRDGHDALSSPDLTPGMEYALYVTPEGAPDGAPEPLPAAARAQYTAVPDELDPGIRRLAEGLFTDCDTVADKIAAVTRHFHAHYSYHFGIEVPPGVNPLTYFLLTEPPPPAHCEYFATGAAILLRLGGVPARYVTGFVASEPGVMGGYWAARNKDAHAWVEAYDDARGWVIVEATPGDGVPGASPPNRLARLWDGVMFALARLRRADFASIISGLLRLLISVPGLLIIAAAVGVLLLRNWRKRVRAAGRRPVDPAVAALHRLLAQMDARLQPRGLVRGPAETCHRFARRIAAEPDAPDVLPAAAAWYAEYAAVRFRPPIEPEAVERLRAAMPPP